ncbi:MAG: MmgE/PrpD family protein [Burkholderiales bacterium]|nr:MmgE/PrpD family protein [Burkholderiales bacterium]
MSKVELGDDYSLRLCQRIALWRYDDLPSEVVRAAKLLVLDTLGVMGGAPRAPGIAALNQRLGQWEAGGPATGLIGKRRYSPPSAALANGAAAHALDFDDQHDPARSHASCVVLPAILATAEAAGDVGGRDFILGFAIGAELIARLGVACGQSLAHGWHPTMIFGTLAASIAAAKLLGLDAAGLRNALGMGFHQAGGSAQSMRDGVLSKRLGPGFAARNAVLSAFLAADGLTGTARPLEGNAGLFSLYERDEVEPQALTASLGKTWRIPEYSFKPWPGCRCHHAAVGLGIRLHAQGVQAAQVQRIEIGLGRLNWITVGARYDPASGSVTHAQFNAAYSFARALSDGRLDLRSYEPEALSEPAIAALTARTQVIDDPSIHAASQGVRVLLALSNGETLVLHAEDPKGSPRNPMSEAELIAKFHGCFAFGLGAERVRVERLADLVLHLEEVPAAAGAIVAAFPT